MKILLFNPDLFFIEKLGDEVDLKYPALIVLVISIISLLTISLISYSRSLLSIVWSTIVGAYVGWMLITSIYYLISLVFNSSGSFKRLLEFVSYGLVPTIFGHIINLIVYFTLRNSLIISTTNPQLHLKIFIELLIHNPLLQASTLIGFLCNLWSYYIDVYAVMHALNLSRRNAFLTVFIPFFFAFIIMTLAVFIIINILKITVF